MCRGVPVYLILEANKNANRAVWLFDTHRTKIIIILLVLILIIAVASMSSQCCRGGVSIDARHSGKLGLHGEIDGREND